MKPTSLPAVSELDALYKMACSYDSAKFNARCDELDAMTGVNTRPLARVLTIAGLDYRINDCGIAFSVWQGQHFMAYADTLVQAIIFCEEDAAKV